MYASYIKKLYTVVCVHIQKDIEFCVTMSCTRSHCLEDRGPMNPGMKVWGNKNRELDNWFLGKVNVM